MTPATGAHGFPDTSTVPYQMVPDKTSINSGETVTLTLQKISSSIANFIGFMVEALDPDNNDVIVGTFASSSTVKPVTCDSSYAAAHKSGTGKRSVTMTWTAPIVDSVKTFNFVFTVMQSKRKHWVKQDATTQLTVGVSNTAVAQTSIAGSITTIRPTRTTKTTTKRSNRRSTRTTAQASTSDDTSTQIFISDETSIETTTTTTIKTTKTTTRRSNRRSTRASVHV
jgi:hypothetical protein